MPLILQRAIDHIMDSLVPELRHETFRVLDEHLQFLQVSRSPNSSAAARMSFSPLSPRRSSPLLSEHRLAKTAGKSPIPALGLPLGLQVCYDALHFLRRGRAWMLHTLWPHNQSIWNCLRSPQWWLLELLGVLPSIGSWWWLLLSAAVDKADEYQLCQFIVALRCSHFFTLGVAAAFYSCLQAYRCSIDPMLLCRDLAPRMSNFSSCFWVLQLTIALRAFTLLPHSLKKGQRIIERRNGLSAAARAAVAAGKSPLPTGTTMGGVLIHLMWLDMILASLVLVASAWTIYASREYDAIFITLYWIRTLHGLASLPYVIFRLPGANTLLTHARRTGYDSLGHTVPFCTSATTRTCTANQSPARSSAHHDSRVKSGALAPPIIGRLSMASWLQ